MLFVDDQVVTSNTEENLQIAAYKLKQIITIHGLITPAQKTKLVAVRGWDPVRSKIITDSKITWQVNSFHYLDNLTSYEKEVDIDNKLKNYLKINSMFRPQKTLKTIRIKLYNTLALPAPFKVVKIGPLEQEMQEEKQQQRRSIWEKQEDTLGQIIQ